MATLHANQSIRSVPATFKPCQRTTRKQNQAQPDKLSIASDLPDPLPVLAAEIQLVLVTLGATIASILGDDE